MRRSDFRWDPATVWTTVGVTSTVWGVIITIILSVLSPIGVWCETNQHWLIPTLAVILLFTTFGSGVLLALLGQSDLSGRDGVTDLVSLWERERRAAHVWVVSPELHYDILNPACHEVVSANRARNVEYRYIVQETAQTLKRIEEYQKIYGETNNGIERLFLRLPATDLSTFLTEIVIYDADGPMREAYGYPPATRAANPDVVVFNEQARDMYIEKFKRLWLEHMVPMPSR